MSTHIFFVGGLIVETFNADRDGDGDIDVLQAQGNVCAASGQNLSSGIPTNRAVQPQRMATKCSGLKYLIYEDEKFYYLSHVAKA